MVFRPGGLSDDESSDEISPNPGAAPTKVSNDEHVRESELQNNGEQDCQFRALSACMSGHLDIIDEYLSLGRNVNDFLYTGWTLLLYGASAMAPSVIQHLLTLGADPNKHKDGFTPLMAVCSSKNGSSEVCCQCISMLMDAKANADATNKDRTTALMYACRTREPEVVEELLKYVKDIEATDTDGRTALFYAVTSKQPEIVKILMKHKASTTVVDRRNLTVKDIAETKNLEEILQLFNFEDEEIENFCPVAKLTDWYDVFTNIEQTDPECINDDIANMLYGMGLDKYRQNFRGMNLKTFLQLKDADLVKLGVDIEYHRKKFLGGLLRFHSAKWKSHTIKIVDKSAPYLLYDGVISVANIARQITIINSSIRYITNNLMMSNSHLEDQSELEKEAYMRELLETEDILKILKTDVERLLKFSEKVEKSSNCELPALYIGPAESKKKMNWIVICAITLMTGIFLSKTTYAQKLWSCVH